MIYSKKSKRDGVTRWFIRYERPDAKERVRQGKSPRKKECAGRSKQDAKDLLIKREAEKLAGTWVDPDAPAAAPERGPTFEDFADRFLKEHPGKRRSNHYPSNVRELVKHFGPRYLREITRADLDAYRVLLSTTARKGRKLSKEAAEATGETHGKRAPLSSTTVLKRLRTLHRIFKQAVRWGELPANPAADMEKPSPNNGKTRWLSREEFDRLEAAAAPWVRPMLRLAVGSGLRLSEVAKLRWDGVDFGAGVLHVEADTKTGAGTVPMTAAARAVLQKQEAGRRESLVLRRSPYVFTATAQREGDETNYTSEFQRGRISDAAVAAAKAAGLEGRVGFHTLRHTAAAWMVQAGASLYEVQRVLRHSSPLLTQRYSHLSPDHLKRATDALDKMLAQGPVSVPDSESATTESAVSA